MRQRKNINYRAGARTCAAVGTARSCAAHESVRCAQVAVRFVHCAWTLTRPWGRQFSSRVIPSRFGVRHPSAEGGTGGGGGRQRPSRRLTVLRLEVDLRTLSRSAPSFFLAVTHLSAWSGWWRIRRSLMGPGKREEISERGPGGGGGTPRRSASRRRRKTPTPPTVTRRPLTSSGGRRRRCSTQGPGKRGRVRSRRLTEGHLPTPPSWKDRPGLALAGALGARGRGQTSRGGCSSTESPTARVRRPPTCLCGAAAVVL